MKARIIVLVLLSSSLGWGCFDPTPDFFSDPDYLHETQAELDARMEWWRDARFGMFIHWGAYANLAGVYRDEHVPGVGEWIMNTAHIPVSDYEQVVAEFNPTQFDAEAWVSIAKQAGMKYIVITSKHHDGFAIWNSRVSDYDIMDASPFERDALKELASAARNAGLRFGVYHSIMDWHHPDAQSINYPDYNGGGAINPNFPQYVENYLKPQVRELIEEYDPDILWFDGEWVPDWTHEMGQDMYSFSRSLKPSILINNRVDKGRQGMAGMDSDDMDYAGDFGTPEQEIPLGAVVIDWESCMTMNDTWGYKLGDQNWKSAGMLVYNLVDIAAKGGNFLLNVGPTAEGLIPTASIERLAEMGKWMDVNGEAIYESRAWDHYMDNDSTRYTSVGETVYAVRFGWPGESLVLSKIKPEEGSTIHLLGFPDALKWDYSQGEGLTVYMPAEWQNMTNRPVGYAYTFKMVGAPILLN